MAFDVKGALDAGYSLSEINDFLGQQSKFDVNSARQAGYNDDEILGFLSSRKLEVAPEAAPAALDPQPITATPDELSRANPDTPAPQGKGLISQIVDALRPGTGSVMDGYKVSSDQVQANRDQLLSYGVGPIRSETAAKADLVRSGVVQTDEPGILKIAQQMAERDEPGLVDLVSRAKQNDVQAQEDAADRARRERFAEENLLLGSLASGSAGMMSGMANIPSVAADAFNQTFVNPVLEAVGLKPIGRVPTAFGTEYLAKAADAYMPAVGKQEMGDAWDKNEFAPWLMSKLAANSPQIAQSLLAAFVPPLRAVLLPSLSGTAAGQSYAQGDDSRVAVAKGAVEYASEKLPLGVFDKIGDVLKGVSIPKQNAILAVAGQRLLQSGSAVTALTLTNAIEETAAQLGGNALDKYFQGKDVDLTKGLAEAAVIGGATGKLMSVPQATAALTGYYEPGNQIARAIEQNVADAQFVIPAEALARRALSPQTYNPRLIDPVQTVDPAKMQQTISQAQSVDEAIAVADQLTGSVAQMTGPIEANLAAAAQMPPATPVIETSEQVLASADNQPAQGLVRMYHGGNPEGVDGPLWFTADLEDAKGWAGRSPGMGLWYVDVPERTLVEGFGVNTIQEAKQQGFAPLSRIELPAEIANQRQPLNLNSSQTTAPTADPIIEQQFGLDQLRLDNGLPVGITPTNTPNTPRPQRIQGKDVSSFTDDQLDQISQDETVPAITRRGALVELTARRNEAGATMVQPSEVARVEPTLNTEQPAVSDALADADPAGRIEPVLDVNTLTFPPMRDTPVAPVGGELAAGRARRDAQKSVKAWAERQGVETPAIFNPAPVELDSAVNQIAQLVNTQLGGRIYAYSDGREGAVNGVSIRGVAFVNTANLEVSAGRTALHEFKHTVEQIARAEASQGLTNTPAQRFTAQIDSIYDDMTDAGKQAYIEKFLHKDELAAIADPAARQARVQELMQSPQTRSEMTADFLGNRATDRQFWLDIAQADPQGFRGFVQKWLRTIDNLINALRGKPNQNSDESARVDRYVRDLNKAKMVAREALIAYSRAAQGQTQADAEQTPAFSPRTRGGKAEQVGDFTVRTQKDGTLGVTGDVNEIRALLPDGVKGRPIPGGIVFTTSDAPRVRAALEGRKLAYSRAGQVLDKLPMKNGKYIGAPEKYNTPAKISTLRKNLRKLTLEGERGRYWYENSSRAILMMAGGNVQEARKFVALLAIYSPQAKVDANSTFALRAWAQYKAGQKISVKTEVMDNKAQAALDDVDAFWSGEKTGNFFFNLLREIDPTTAGKQGATIDMWMMRAGEYNTDAPTATQYAFMENETNRIAQELSWEPQQVQAAIWVAMKARMENAGVKRRTEQTSEKKGWIRFDYPLKKGKPVKTRVILNAQAHRNNWLKHAFAHTPTQADTEQAKFDFSDGVRRHIGQISWEARPGRSTNVLPGVNDASYEQQTEFQQAVQKALLDDNGIDLLAYKLGLLVDGPDILAPGVWQGEIAAGMQKRVAMAPAKGDDGKSGIDPAQSNALSSYAAVLGLLLRQEGVGYHRPFYSAKKSGENGVNLDIGRTFTPDEAQSLWGAIDARMKELDLANWEKDAGLVSSPSGMRVVNFGAISDNKVFRELVKDAAETLTIDGIKLGSFTSDGDLIENKWKENPNGESYRSRIAASGSPDLLGWTRDVLAPRIQAVFNEFSSRYGWGNPGQVDSLFRPEDGQQASAEEVNEPSFSRRQKDSWLVGRDEVGRINFGPGAKAYDAVAALANRVLDYVKLKPISPELSRAIKRMKNEIEKVQDLTARTAELLKDIPESERQMISDVIEGELNAGVTPPQRVLNLAASMQGIMSQQSTELVRLGMLSSAAAARWDNKYLPRFYESKLGDEAKAWARAAKSLFGRQATMQGIKGDSLKARGMFETIDVADLAQWQSQGWEQRDPDFDPAADTQTVVWRDFSRTERERMGEIRDAMFRFTMGYMRTQRDIALGRLYESLSQNYASAKPMPGYVQVPNTKVEGTMASRYGKLSNMWVPPEVLDQLSNVDRSLENGVLKIYRSALSKWKEGKALALDTPIPTPAGWTTMGDIQVGDVIFDENGKPCTVTFATPVQLDRKCFEVEFSDGEKIVADAEHLWFTVRQGKPGVRTTEQIAGTLKYAAGKYNAHSVPVAGSLVIPDAQLPVDPYYLGVWLGNGTSRGTEITSCEADSIEIMSMLKSRGFGIGAVRKDPRGDIVTYQVGFNDHRPRKLLLQPALRAIGVLGDKHIPTVYLRASERQRMDLLRGLMDTDGTIDKNGKVSFCTASKKLLDGFIELARSLGFKPAFSEVSKKYQNGISRAWVVRMHAPSDRPVFLLQRKRARLAAPVTRRARSQSRQIVSITPVQSVPVRCIQVSSESRLYLAGRGMIPTHNTVLNPVSHANNVISNVTQAHFAGVSYWDVQKYAGAIKDLVANSAMVEEAKDVGLFGGTFVQSEIVQSMPPQLRQLAGMSESKLSKMTEGIWDTLAFTVQYNGKKYGARPVMQWAYEHEDLFFRYLIYRDARKRGLAPEDAREFSEQYIFTYDDLPRGARVIRDAAIPFFTYSYKITPVLARTLLEYPWRFAAPAAVAYAANAAMYAAATAIAGGDDDEWWGKLLYRYATDAEFRQRARDLEKEERKNLPPWMKGASILGTPKAIRMGMDDVTGLPMFLDISRVVPGGDIVEAENNAGGLGIPNMFAPNNPILTTLMALQGNRDLFTGKDVVNKDTDTSAEQAEKRAAWAWKQFSPAIAVGNYHFNRAMNVVANVTGQPITLQLGENRAISWTGTGRDGLPTQPELAALQTVGIKLRPIDLDTSAQIAESNRKRILRDLATDMKRLQRLENKGAISPEAADVEREQIIIKRDRVRERLTVDGDEPK